LSLANILAYFASTPVEKKKKFCTTSINFSDNKMNEDWTEIELTVERKAIAEDFILQCDAEGKGRPDIFKTVQYPFLVTIPGVNL
jgi:hypothetical protein